MKQTYFESKHLSSLLTLLKNCSPKGQVVTYELSDLISFIETSETIIHRQTIISDLTEQAFRDVGLISDSYEKGDSVVIVITANGIDLSGVDKVCQSLISDKLKCCKIAVNQNKDSKDIQIDLFIGKKLTTK